MLSIKEELEKVGFDTNNVLEIEYRKAKFYLERVIFTTEKTLITLQNAEEQNQQRIESVERTLNRLCFAWGQITKQESRIKELESENKMLKDKFEFFKIKP